MVFARHTATDGDVVLVSDRDRLTFCTRLGATTWSGPGSRTSDLPPVSDERPVIRLTGPDTAASKDGDAHAGAAYVVGPQVADLQMRVVVDGVAGGWFGASIHDGYASAAATASISSLDLAEVTLQVQDRAFDAEGNELPIDRTR